MGKAEIGKPQHNIETPHVVTYIFFSVFSAFSAVKTVRVKTDYLAPLSQTVNAIRLVTGR
jgi:hypothetical protein